MLDTEAGIENWVLRHQDVPISDREPMEQGMICLMMDKGLYDQGQDVGSRYQGKGNQVLYVPSIATYLGIYSVFTECLLLNIP